MRIVTHGPTSPCGEEETPGKSPDPRPDLLIAHYTFPALRDKRCYENNMGYPLWIEAEF